MPAGPARWPGIGRRLWWSTTGIGYPSRNRSTGPDRGCDRPRGSELGYVPADVASRRDRVRRPCKVGLKIRWEFVSVPVPGHPLPIQVVAGDVGVEQPAEEVPGASTPSRKRSFVRNEATISGQLPVGMMPSAATGAWRRRRPDSPSGPSRQASNNSTTVPTPPRVSEVIPGRIRAGRRTPGRRSPASTAAGRRRHPRGGADFLHHVNGEMHPKCK